MKLVSEFYYTVSLFSLFAFTQFNDCMAQKEQPAQKAQPAQPSMSSLLSILGQVGKQRIEAANQNLAAAQANPQNSAENTPDVEGPVKAINTGTLLTSGLNAMSNNLEQSGADEGTLALFGALNSQILQPFANGKFSALGNPAMLANQPRNITLKDSPYYDTVRFASITLPRIEQIDRYFFIPFNLTITNLTCSVTGLTDVNVRFNQESDETPDYDQTHIIEVIGLSTACRLDLDWEYGYAWGGGEVNVASDSESPDELSMTFEYDKDSKEVVYCDSDIELVALSYESGLISTVIEVLEWVIVKSISFAVNQLMCIQLSYVIAAQTESIAKLEAFMQFASVLMSPTASAP